MTLWTLVEGVSAVESTYAGVYNCKQEFGDGNFFDILGVSDSQFDLIKTS
jgi:hypothetical protein